MLQLRHFVYYNPNQRCAIVTLLIALRYVLPLLISIVRITQYKFGFTGLIYNYHTHIIIEYSHSFQSCQEKSLSGNNRGAQSVHEYKSKAIH